MFEPKVPIHLTYQGIFKKRPKMDFGLNMYLILFNQTQERFICFVIIFRWRFTGFNTVIQGHLYY